MMQPELADLWTTLATTQGYLKKDKESQKTWVSAANEYRKGARSEEDRGPNLELAYCLWKSGAASKADELYRKLEKRYPQEFTFFYGHANMNFELKKMNEAEDLATRAYKLSYGDNHLRSATLLAKILKSQGKKKEAQEIVQNTLSQSKVTHDQNIRTFRYVKVLQALGTTLN